MEFDQILVKESPGLCRCCLSEGCYKDLSVEYTWMNDNEIYAEMLLECFDISLSQQSEGPNGPNRLICEVCITRLRDACNFKRQVVDTEKKFIEMVARGDFKPKVLVYEEQMKIEPIHQDNTDDQEVEYLEEVDCDDDDDEEYLPPEDLDKPSASKDYVEPEAPVIRKRGRPRKNAKIEKKIKTPRGKVLSIGEAESKSSLTPSQCGRMRRQNIINILRHTTVTPFKYSVKHFLCFYCHQPYQSIKDLKQHIKIDHLNVDIKKAVDYLQSREKVKIDICESNCKLCRTELENIESIIGHLKVNHKVRFNDDFEVDILPFKLNDGKFTCAMCDKEFPKYMMLSQHINVHYNSHVCDVCRQTFSNRRRLLSHRRSRHDLMQSIKKNNTVLKKELNITDCVKTENDNTKYTCDYCNKTYYSRYMILCHIKNHNRAKTKYKCHICLKTRSSQMALNTHMLRHKVVRNDEDNQIDTVQLEPLSSIKSNRLMRLNAVTILKNTTALPFKWFAKGYTCFYCHTSCQDKNQLANHTAQHIDVDVDKAVFYLRCDEKVKIDVSMLSCKVCHEIHKSIDNIVDHLKVCHNLAFHQDVTFGVIPYKLDFLQCAVCEERFKSFIKLNQHINQHYGTHVCEICGKALSTKDRLNNHKRWHFKRTLKFKCNVCSEMFSSIKKRNEHESKDHVTGSEIKCSHCEILFENYSLRRKHQYEIHNITENEFVCPVCDKTFLLNSRMKMHMRKDHSSNVKYTCDICSKTFLTKTLIREHMSKHSDKASFECGLCKKPYTRKSGLKIHMKMHVNDNHRFK